MNRLFCVPTIITLVIGLVATGPSAIEALSTDSVTVSSSMGGIWTNFLMSMFQNATVDPPRNSHIFALVQVAIFDTMNAFYRQYTSVIVQATTVDTSGIPATTEYINVAVSFAAHTVVSREFQDYNATSRSSLMIDQLVVSMRQTMGENATASEAFRRAKSLGILVAVQILDKRTMNATMLWADEPQFGSCGDWDDSGPSGYSAPRRSLWSNWGQMTPWVLQTAEQFRPGPPPSRRGFFSNNTEFSLEYDELMTSGGRDSSNRTAEQTEIAYYWEDGQSSASPVGTFGRIAVEIAIQRNMDDYETSRLLVLLAVTQADVAIAIWEAKYFYRQLRPVQIAHNQRNCAIEGGFRAYPDWKPLLPTPPFPDYPSGHSGFGASSAQILRRVFTQMMQFFGSDQADISISSTGYKYDTYRRQLNTFSQMAYENGMSRIWGGVHWASSNVAAQNMGLAISDVVFDSIARPVSTPT